MKGKEILFGEQLKISFMCVFKAINSIITLIIWLNWAIWHAER